MSLFKNMQEALQKLNIIYHTNVILKSYVKTNFGTNLINYELDKLENKFCLLLQHLKI